MTYMQKIDASAMRRELTEHETEIVSGGFGTPDFNVDLPIDSIPDGFTTNDITQVEFVLDSNTNELTTILTFQSADDGGIQFSADHDGDDIYGGSGRTQTRSITQPASTNTITTTSTFSINFGIFKYSNTVTNTTTTNGVTRGTSVTIPLAPPAPPPIGGGNRTDGGTGPRPAIKPH